MKHNKLVNVSAHISEEMKERLEKICNFEKRSKSYYIKQGLERILNEKISDLEDYLSAKKTLEDAKAGNEKFISYDQVFKNIK